MAIACVLALAAFLVFNANGRLIAAADTFAARHLPFSILRNHTVLLDPIADAVALGRSAPNAGHNGTAFWIQQGRDAHLVSKYPLVVPLVVAPLYLPALHYLDSVGWDPHIADKVARAMEKLCASLIAAASVALMFMLLRRRCDARTAGVLSLAYAFGTTTWVISSQALWMHGLAQLLIVATLWLVTGPATLARVAMAGFLCALIAANRPPDALLAAALGLWGLRWAGSRWPWLIVAGGVPVALTLAYNLGAVGHVAGAYALSVHASDFNDNVLEGIAGLLFSPTRGLFVFSPFLLFVPCLFLLALRDRGTRGLTLALGVAIAVQVLGYARVDWRQGIAWGPRWLTDMVPLLVWMLPPIVARLSRPGRVLFAAACVASVAIQAIGAFWYTGAVDTAVLTMKTDDRMRPMWAWRNAAFVAELSHPRVQPDLLADLRGNIDLIQPLDVVVHDAAAGDRLERQLDVAGWALVDSSSPQDIAVLIDGREVAGTNHFFDRPDVAQTLAEKSPAGWRLHVPLGDLQAGRHKLSVLVRPYAGGEVRLLRERFFELPPPGPGDAAERFLQYASRQAVERIAQAQQVPGYWLTSFTSGPRFEQPQPELNTYLNAIMIDLVGPMAHVAHVAQMAPMLARAQGFLASQIEDDGLVRYHGRPDASTIGVLGCAITPDSDDTALVWRVAPAADRAKLAAAMRTLRRFTTGDGLYRTWLAPRADYRCLDPGADPNPADIGIQMHIYLLLAQEDPPAARALCATLKRRADDDSLWVYYAGAPPVMSLRLAEVQRAGCALEVPASRLQPAVPAQAVWAQVASLVARLQDTAPTAAQKAEATRLLQALASHEFAALAGNPPLLYHNDMSATVRRFYWSQEVGYALWLRLYHATRGAQLPPDPAHAASPRSAS
ncbi:hypothetical protein [Variovorax sp. IB41]|uniref:hypothetical protein n=1 Tax=Variovorax sp. IB41 TaxID=2779370 RepID=UPI0018E87354|nr:hypothetical protein [Variovorax sp. IB41]MBJ2156785.1 hypothetical protein [Variovorax sp. IB41]